MNALIESRNPTMSSREIAELTGKQHQHVRRDIEKMFAGLGEDPSNYGRIYSDSMNRQKAEYLLDRYHTEVLVTGYDVKRRAAVIKRWHDLESGKAQPIATQTNIPATTALCELAITVLRPSDSGKVVMLRKAGEAIGADTSFLPEYTEDSAPGHVGAMDTYSLTHLLRELGLGHSAPAVNQQLHSAGILESRTRRTSKGALKHFWCITDAGMPYGKNVVSPQSPRETQPHWYRESFADLLSLIGLEAAA